MITSDVAKALVVEASVECGLVAAGLEVGWDIPYDAAIGGGTQFWFDRTDYNDSRSNSEVAKEFTEERFLFIHRKLRQGGFLATWRIKNGCHTVRVTRDQVTASTVYHVTHRSNVEDIGRHGLLRGRLDRLPPPEFFDAVGNIYFAPDLGTVADASGGRTANGTAHRWRSVFAENRGGSADDYIIYEVDLSLAGHPPLFVDPWSDSQVAIVCPREEPIPPRCLKPIWPPVIEGNVSINDHLVEGS